MIVDIPLFLLALALLFLPRQWVRAGFVFLKKRRRGRSSAPVSVVPSDTREPGDQQVSFMVEFGKLQNYIDLLRAGAASLAFSGGMGMPACLMVGANAPREAAWQVMGVRVAVLLVGLLIQIVRYEKKRTTFFPAIFYLAGLSIGLCDIRAAAFAFILIWVINSALGNAQAFLSVYALLMVAFGFLFAKGGSLSIGYAGTFGHLFAPRGDIWAGYAGILCFLPVLLSLLSNRPLTSFKRKASHARA